MNVSAAPPTPVIANHVEPAPAQPAPSSRRLMSIRWDPSVLGRDRNVKLVLDGAPPFPGFPTKIISASAVDGPVAASTSGMRHVGKTDSLDHLAQVLTTHRAALDALPSNRPDPRGYKSKVGAGEYEITIDDYMHRGLAKVTHGSIDEASAPIADVLRAAAALSEQMWKYEHDAPKI